jgi:hypothetical protein
VPLLRAHDGVAGERGDEGESERGDRVFSPSHLVFRIDAAPSVENGFSSPSNRRLEQELHVARQRCDCEEQHHEEDGCIQPGHVVRLL